jgi:hypothetical protein
MTIGQLAAIRARIAGRLEPHIDVTEIAMAVADLRSLLDEVDRLHVERGNAVVVIDPVTSNNPNLQSSFDSFIRSMRADLENDLLRAVNQRFSVNDAELRAERDAAFRRGAEAMRAAGVEVARKRADLPATSDTDAAWCRSAQCIVDELRELAVPEMTR